MHPATTLTSSLTIDEIALLMIRHEVSPIAIGRTPGHTLGRLSMAMSLEAMKLAIPSRSTYVAGHNRIKKLYVKLVK